MKNILTANTIVIKDEMKYDGVTVLTFKIEYPEFKSSYYQMSLVVINKFYKEKALAYEKHCRTELFNAAVEQYKYSKENNFPVHVHEALVVYKLTYNCGCIVSLYFDQYEYTGGAHGSTLRYSQTFNLQKCSMLKLNELFSCTSDYKAYIFKQILEQIEQDTSIYFEDYAKLIVSTFNESSFYCTPLGIIIYYQQYDIAPYSSGIREFLIPYTNCVIDPIKKCFQI
ncbi:MAG: DUF3298 and DUF4163 domain-containing protein [Oscillospiraceae bacterium]|nr:DUF3298 and DUF4163 domain-containing protein [Oscillospiraceae bacterium]